MHLSTFSVLILGLAIVSQSPANAQPITNTTARLGPECPLVFGVGFVDAITSFEVVVYSDFEPTPLLGVSTDVDSEVMLPIFAATIAPPDCQPVLTATEESATMDIVSVSSETPWPLTPESRWPIGRLMVGISGFDSFQIFADFEIEAGLPCIEEPLMIRYFRDSECDGATVYRPSTEQPGGEGENPSEGNPREAGCSVGTRQSGTYWVLLLFLLGLWRRKRSLSIAG